eukprot:814745-Alexandrium_andersonii.AAC.1
MGPIPLSKRPILVPATSHQTHLPPARHLPLLRQAAAGRPRQSQGARQRSRKARAGHSTPPRACLSISS